MELFQGFSAIRVQEYLNGDDASVREVLRAVNDARCSSPKFSKNFSAGEQQV